MNFTIATKQEAVFCPVCWYPLPVDGVCRRKHKAQRRRIGKYSGLSKTPYGKYEER